MATKYTPIDHVRPDDVFQARSNKDRPRTVPVTYNRYVKVVSVTRPGLAYEALSFWALSHKAEAHLQTQGKTIRLLHTTLVKTFKAIA